MMHQSLDYTSCMYDGSEDPRKFIDFFKITSIINSWDGAAQLLNVMPFLKDKAEAVVTAMTTRDNIAAVFKELREKCSEPPERLMARFNELKPKKGESYSKYITELKRLLKGASPDLSDAQILIQIRAHLRRFLAPDTILLFQIYKDKTLNELMQYLDDAIPNGAEMKTDIAAWNPTPTIKCEPSSSN